MPKMTFIERNGLPREVEAPIGLSVLEVAHKYGVDIEGANVGVEIRGAASPTLRGDAIHDCLWS